MTTITVKLPEELEAQLDVAAKRRRTSRSEVVRQLLEQGLRKPGHGAGASCYELARDLCGSVKGAPPDLSTNKRHLEGFGQ
ncbi:MAG TPA: ribbon-helix-helix domain-containing protein [Verrucomicrobiae bacterium]|nr:ribbon-helix-helix domain-containing protein [Verrucomicrobiae bacterium]